MIAALFGINDYKTEQKFSLAIIDMENMPEAAERETFIPTYENVISFGKRELLSDFENRGIDNPDIMNQIMNPEFSVYFKKSIIEYKEAGGDIYNEKSFTEYVESNSSEDSDLLIARFRTMNQLGANELFSGNGLTEVDLESPWGKHVNTKYGVVETFTFERDPLTINQLGDAVAIISATPIPVN
ncbi:hypothetical protein [Pseudoalteromonas prydzensis]|uniref:Uncharacterized protein n=1 Tax=Pseudoalteromonas prydzensis TaxID=182141 RepID=A0ABR9FSW6_9GAMM|nr:hypothetical protein [Pseudoalteromonas prydzensis]MBE0459915.1 hypothetical protein [Pseudoalteromonas prydzensis]